LEVAFPLLAAVPLASLALLASPLASALPELRAAGAARPEGQLGWGASLRPEHSELERLAVLPEESMVS
jgi:hypothetical protein